MDEINQMTLAQIKRHTTEVAQLRLTEQQQFISSIALGAQGDKNSITNALGKLADAQRKLKQPPKKIAVKPRVANRPPRQRGDRKPKDGEL